jgi:hypothetical protein
MVGYTVGVLALLAHEHQQLRLVAAQEASGSIESGLVPYRRAQFGEIPVLLQTRTTGPENEDYAGGTTVTVFRAARRA